MVRLMVILPIVVPAVVATWAVAVTAVAADTSSERAGEPPPVAAESPTGRRPLQPLLTAPILGDQHHWPLKPAIDATLDRRC